MQGEQSRKSRKGIYFEKLLVTFPILLHIFFALSFFFFFFCFLSTVFSQISLCLPSCTTIFKHSPFLLILFCHPVTTSVPGVSCAVLCTDVTNQAIRPKHLVSCKLQIAGNLRCLISSLSTDSYILTLSLMSRSDWSWAKSHWWITGWWL